MQITKHTLRPPTTGRNAGLHPSFHNGRATANPIAVITRALGATSSRRDTAEEDFADAAPERILRPRREPSNPSNPRGGDRDKSPSTSGRDRPRDNGGDRGWRGSRRDEDRPYRGRGDNVRKDNGYRRRDDLDDDGSWRDRGGARERSVEYGEGRGGRGSGMRSWGRGRGLGSGVKEDERGAGGGPRPGRRDGREENDERRFEQRGRGGRDGERDTRTQRQDRDSIRAGPHAQGDGGPRTSPAAEDEEPVVGVPRPPGSSTGNKPLPYDLPIVRANDDDKGTFFAGGGWQKAGASAEIAAALRTLGITRPSHIQAQAFSTLRGGADGASAGGGAFVLADQAGSGKTLAYLLPLLQELRAEEAAAGGRVTQPGKPRGIVVAPTVELVQQVLRVVRALSNAGLRCRSAAVTGGQADEKARAASFRTQRELLREGVDLLVATPGRLLKHLEARTLKLDACRALVLDEVDVLMGDRADFLGQVQPLRDAAPASMRFVMVTATMPQHTFSQLQEVWPQLEAVFGPGLHRTASGLVEELVDCSGGDEISEESGKKRKLEALQGLLDRHRSPRTIVFCNKIGSCRDVENFLKRVDPKEAKYRVMPYHEAIRDDLRSEIMTEFLRPVGSKKQLAQAARPAGASGEASTREDGDSAGEVPLVLVATDRTSRGIDVLHCEHVVLFDFPRDPSEYVRRVGRTARGAGGRGTVSSLVLGRQVPLAREIIDRNQKGMPVHSVPA